MKYQSLFIANLAELALPLAELMSENKKKAEIFEDHALCDRFLFQNQESFILVTPFPVDQDFAKDSAALMGYRQLLNLYPKSTSGSICQSMIRDLALWQKIKRLIKENPGIKIISYAATEQFLDFIDRLKRAGLEFETPELPQKNCLWTSAFFGSKAGFRQTASKLGPNFPSLPQGAICCRQDEVIGWVKYLLKNSGGCVLKTNRGLAGAGVKILRQGEVPLQSLDAFIKSLLRSESYWQKEPVIVEEYIETDLGVSGGNPDVEFMIDSQGIRPLYYCGMRVDSEGHFRGIEIGKEAGPKKLVNQLFLAGSIWANKLKEAGYQGFFDLDCVYGRDGKVYPIESNVRRTGGTHVYELGQRLLGPNFLKQYYLVSNNMVHTPRFLRKKYQAVKRELSPSLYPMRNKKEGLIITSTSYLVKGYLGYVIVGKNRKRVSEIEGEFLKLL